MDIDEFGLMLISILNNAYQYKCLTGNTSISDNVLIDFIVNNDHESDCDLDVLNCLMCNSDGMIKGLADDTIYHVSVDVSTLLDTYYITPDSQYYEYFMKVKRWTIWATAKGYKPCNKYNPVNDIVLKIFEMCAKQCKYICLSKDIVTAVNEIFREKSMEKSKIKLI